VQAPTSSVLNLCEFDLVFGELKAETLNDLVFLVDELRVVPRVAAVD
jgi:hypothetical protein